jgi:hypothetical protein
MSINNMLIPSDIDPLFLEPPRRCKPVCLLCTPKRLR